MAPPGSPDSGAFWSVVAVAATLALGLAGCGDRVPNRPPTRPAPPQPTITIEELRATEYPADLLDRAMVRLTDGAFTPPLSGRDAMAGMELHPTVAIAAPDPDRSRAAAITMESGGGTGMFYWLHLLERRSGALGAVASAYLGDRVEVVSLRFVADTIVVRLVTQGPTDALCCPTLEVVQRFVPKGGALVEVTGAK